jgi:hypothetical protein
MKDADGRTYLNGIMLDAPLKPPPATTEQN